MTTFPTITLSDPAEMDIVGYRGDSGSFRVTVEKGGAPLDVSGATWDADIRTAPDAPVLATMTVTPVVGTTNAVDVSLDSASSTKVTEEEAVWDLEMTLGGVTTTLIRGAIRMTKDVSRPPFEPPPVEMPEGVPVTASTAGSLGDVNLAAFLASAPTGPLPSRPSSPPPDSL